MFTHEELAEMAAADAEIDATFELTSDDLRLAASLDREAKLSRLLTAEREKKERKRRNPGDAKARYWENREKCLARVKDYNRRNKEKIAAYKHAYYMAHKEEYAARSKLWRANNREKCHMQQRSYYKNNREKCLEYQKEYYWRKKNGQVAIEGNPAQNQRAAAQA